MTAPENLSRVAKNAAAKAAEIGDARRHTISAALAIAGVLLAGSAVAADRAIPPVAGRAAVVDGDTLDIGDARVRLWGIDAPEARQTCLRSDEDWPCGTAASAALAEWIAGLRVACRPRYRDRDGRLVARCDTAGRDLSAAMVAAGWAFDYPSFSGHAFQAEERRARARRLGIWQGVVTEPWRWRAEHRRVGGSGEDRRCRIKGNINAAGQRIAHVPGQRDYAAVAIALSRGERWFCSTAAARSAGWRLAQR